MTPKTSTLYIQKLTFSLQIPREFRFFKGIFFIQYDISLRKLIKGEIFLGNI